MTYCNRCANENKDLPFTMERRRGTCDRCGTEPTGSCNYLPGKKPKPSPPPLAR